VKKRPLSRISVHAACQQADQGAASHRELQPVVGRRATLSHGHDGDHAAQNEVRSPQALGPTSAKAERRASRDQRERVELEKGAEHRRKVRQILRMCVRQHGVPHHLAVRHAGAGAGADAEAQDRHGTRC
jgi:hypothetical protein